MLGGVREKSGRFPPHLHFLLTTHWCSKVCPPAPLPPCTLPVFHLCVCSVVLETAARDSCTAGQALSELGLPLSLAGLTSSHTVHLLQARLLLCEEGNSAENRCCSFSGPEFSLSIPTGSQLLVWSPWTPAFPCTDTHTCALTHANTHAQSETLHSHTHTLHSPLKRASS